MNDDLIRRGDALNVIKRNHNRLQGDGLTYTVLIEQMKLVPKEKDLLYICDRERCDNCHSECELTSDINHAAGAGAVVIFDKAAMPKQSEWIPCSERLPEYRKLVLVTTRDLRVKPAYLDSIQDDGTDDLWSIPLDDADCALWNIVAWMPLPKPYKEGADNER